jgi:hypothetical protein
VVRTLCPYSSYKLFVECYDADKKVTYVDVSVDDTRNVMINARMQEWGVDELMEQFQKTGNARMIS